MGYAIYKVTNLSNGKIYIGQTCQSLALNITKTYVSNVCNGKIKKHNKGNFAFV